MKTFSTKALEPAKKLPSYEALQSENQELRNQVEFLTHQLLELKRHVFGRRSERSFSELQEPLFPVEAVQLPEVVQEEKVEVDSYERNKRNGRAKLPNDLQVERIEYEPQEQACASCGKELSKIGEEVTEQLDFVPASFVKRHLVRIKRACSCCKDKVVIGEIPPEKQVFDRCKAGAGLVSHVLVSKYCDHLPLNRQEQMYARQGIEISRKTMCDWVARSVSLLGPVVEEMKQSILKAKKIHADETSLQVQTDAGFKKGYLWGYLADKQVVFEYSCSRSREVPHKFFGDYNGFIQADGYQGYNFLFDIGAATRVGCWAHVRRKFFELESTHPAERKEMLNLIKKLYRIERKAKEDKLTDEQIEDLRGQRSKPLIDAIGQCLNTWSQTALPKSPLGLAVAYARSQWEELSVFINFGFIEIDNNPIERQIRPIAVGRKNWLFAGSENGAKRAATLFGIINTCKLNKINPFEYLLDVLPKLAQATPEQIKSFTPIEWKTVRQRQILNSNSS